MTIIVKNKDANNIIIGTLFSFIITFVWQIIKAIYFEKVDMNTIGMFFIVYTIPSLIFCAIIQILYSMFFYFQKWKTKLLAIVILGIHYWFIASLLTTQIEAILQITVFPLLISFLIILLLNLKRPQRVI